MTYREAFELLNTAEIEYIVPRKYDYLPESTIEEEGDVDIIIREDEFDEAIQILKANGFKKKNINTSIFVDLASKALSSPKRAVEILLFERKTAKRLVTNSSSSGKHKNTKLFTQDLYFDIRNNLAYKSPMNNRRIPVTPEVTAGMFKRRVEHSCFYIPHPSDELAHIIPHCVYDKKGHFSDYYVHRCDELFEEITIEQRSQEIFIELLEMIFYDAHELVYDLISESRYEDIWQELWQFDDY